MNTHQIAVEAWNDIIGSIVVCSCSPQQYDQAVLRIESAIEKAMSDVALVQDEAYRIGYRKGRTARATESEDAPFDPLVD